MVVHRTPNSFCLVLVVHFIGDNAGLPTKEARTGVAELMERFRHQRACLAVLRHLAEINLPRPVASTEFVRERARRKNRRNIRDISRIFPRTKAANGPVARPQLANLFLPGALVPSKFQMLVSDRIEEVVKWLPEPHERRSGTHIEPGHLLSALERLDRIMHDSRDA